jgi:phenylacetate-CoA ligase
MERLGARCVSGKSAADTRIDRISWLGLSSSRKPENETREAGVRIGGGPGAAKARGRAIFRPTARLLLLRLMLPLLDRLLAVLRGYRSFLWVTSALPPGWLEIVGRWRAARAADHALRTVPAYGAFATEQQVTPSDLLTLGLPFTDKQNYILRFALAERCVQGRLPRAGLAIDESSGSTGAPYNWVRSLEERETSHVFISHFARYCFGKERLVTINAFSMGAWATGINMGIALQRNGVVKNTGPEAEKIFATLAFLGNGFRYLICGYPPFLKHLIDLAQERAFPLHDYSLRALVGGEGMSEGLRDYLSSHFSPVFSGYGATDVEIGLAGETPLSVAIRRQARSDATLRRLLFGDDPRLPMLFQYNPLSHYVKASEAGELMFSINRLQVLSPRVMYNIHDEGGVASFAAMIEKLRSAGIELSNLIDTKWQRPLRLPFLWIYGRKDSTVSVMGANIYPEDLEQALYDEPELAALTHSFCLGLEEERDGALRPVFSFEVRGEITPELTGEFEHRIVARVRAMNADFRTALEEHEQSARPLIRLFRLGTGPFTSDASKIKQTRIIALEPRTRRRAV